MSDMRLLDVKSLTFTNSHDATQRNEQKCQARCRIEYATLCSALAVMRAMTLDLSCHTVHSFDFDW